MKPVLILILGLFTIIPSCTKEPKLKSTALAARPECLDDHWDMNANFYGDKPFNYPLNIPYPLVYNNKIYVFDVGDDKIRVFDGSSWTLLLSNIPISTYDIPNFGFTIGSKGYIGHVDINTLTHTFYEYDFINNTWAQKANFPGQRRTECSAVSYAIGNKGYVVGGLSENNGNAITLKDNWEYDPANDTWTQKAEVPSANRVAYGGGFSVLNKGYIVCGKFITEPSSTLLKQTIEYDPATDSWATKAQFPGQARYLPNSFVIGSTAYVGAGRTDAIRFHDFYKFSPSSNTWSQVKDIPVTNYAIFGFTLNNKGYVELASSVEGQYNFLYKYTPRSCAPPPSHL